MENPERHIELGIRIGADDRPSLIRALKRITGELECGEGESVISGGYDSGYTVRVAERTNEGIDHDEYFRLVDGWIEERG